MINRAAFASEENDGRRRTHRNDGHSRPDEAAGYAAEPIQQVNKEYFSELWGIRSIEAKIKETQQKKELTKITLDMINDSLKDILKRIRKAELERTISRINDRIRALREHNAELESLMIQAGKPPQEVAVLNYWSEVGLDVYLEMKSEVEELLKACKPHKQEHKGNRPFS